MNKRNAIRMGCLTIYVLVGILLIGLIQPQKVLDVSLRVKLLADYAMDFQIFFSETNEFSEEVSETFRYEEKNESKTFEIVIPDSTNYIRMDFGSQEGNAEIQELRAIIGNEEIDLLSKELVEQISLNMIEKMNEDYSLTYKSIGEDPFVIMQIKNGGMVQLAESEAVRNLRLRRSSMGIALLLMGGMFFRFRKKIYSFGLKLFCNRSLILDLARNDFKTRFAGSYLGIVWAFVQPVVTILVYWFVFQVGFRSGVKGDVPFVLWLAAGLVPWFFFNEALNSATSSLLDYSYLVKKVVFDIQIIPLVRILSALFVHLFFVLLIIFMFLLGGVYPDLTWIQLPYYSLCLILFTLGLSYATSALINFFRDLGQIIIVILQVGIWITPIMWDWEIIPLKLQWLFKINPMYYIVQGYRDALIYHRWFWNNTVMTVYFWGILFLVIWGGMAIFNKLRVHFADVL